jgi:hypothetical protein
MSMDIRRARKIVESIFSLGSEIRYAEIFNNRAVSIAGGMKPGVKSIDPARTAAKVDVETARYALLLIRRRKYYGAMHYMYVRLEKVNVLVLPFDNGVLVITLNPPKGLELLEDIRQKISQYY